MRWCLGMLVVLVVSAQEKDNDKLELSFDSCPIGGGCPNDKCCTDYACEEQEENQEGKGIKCCNKEELISEQQLPQENRICSPCVQCSSNCPRTISILSNGGGAESWKDQLGCYNLVRYDDTGNAVYKHDLENGNFLFKTKANDKMWMVGNKVGENFGWIGHPDCSEECPTSCEYKSWKYWKGITGGDGAWENDENLRIEAPPQRVKLRIEGVRASSSEHIVKIKGKREETISVDCIAKQATPTPIFEWKIGGDVFKDGVTINERIDSTSDSGNADDYIETLEFVPKYHHDGKKLTCTVIHQAYTDSQKSRKENEAETILKVHYPPAKTEESLDQVVTWGEENQIQIQFNANPMPKYGHWLINGTKVSFGTTTRDKKYTSSPLFGTGDYINGNWIVELTLRELTLHDSMKPHHLVVENEEGKFRYDFKLAIDQPTPSTLPPPKDWPVSEEGLKDDTINECYKYETSYTSDDIGYNIGIKKTMEECQLHCQNTTGCNYFAFESEPKRCRLKASNGDVQYSKNTIAGPKYCENGNFVVILLVVTICVVASIVFLCCCCFLETSGEDPERYVVFKSDRLNVSRQMLPKVLENSSFLVYLVSIIEEWRDKVLCIENKKNASVVECDETGVKIELKGIDKVEEANGI